MRTFLLFILSITALSGCKKYIKGNVTDNFGNAVSNASVSILNSSYYSSTDEVGNYKIEYVPGEIAIMVQKDGYITDTLKVSIYKKENYNASYQTLFKLPERRGVYYQTNSEYIPLTEVKTKKYDIASHWEQYTVEWYVVEHGCVQIPFDETHPPFYNIVIHDFFTSNSGFSSYPECLALYQVYGDNGEFGVLTGEVFGSAKLTNGKMIKMEFTKKGKTLFIKANLNKGKYVLTRKAYAPWIANDPSFMFELTDNKVTSNTVENNPNNTTSIQPNSESNTNELSTRGTISQIEGGNSSLTMTLQTQEQQGNSREVYFLLNKNTKIISKNSKYKTIADLENNLEVTVTYAKASGDVITAKSIEVLN